MSVSDARNVSASSPATDESLWPVIQQRGLWFEEMHTGVVYRHAPGRTISEADNTLFSTLTMNPQALHLDAARSAEQEFGERLVNSLLTLSVVVGLSVNQLTQSTIIANLGFSEVTFPLPVRHGDTLYAETTLLDKRLSRTRPDQGVVTFRHTGRNQHGAVVTIAVRASLISCRPTDTAHPTGSAHQTDPADTR